MMEEITQIAALRKVLDSRRASGATIGLVPTMGYLHEGHTSLMARARSECDVVVATIFVNPLQFGPSEDLSSYPRDLQRDRQLAVGAGVDFLFVPEVTEMYPQAVVTTVSVSGVSEQMEGATRPTHFSGVATVVAKILNIVGATRAYFGEKDFQQLAVVKRMVSDLSFPVEVVGCETIREPDGLALSSRNAYLSDTERQSATVLKRALDTGAKAIASGERNGNAIRQLMSDVVAKEPLVSLDYAQVANPDTLEAVHDLSPYGGQNVRLLIAAQVGKPRLLDNISAAVPLSEPVSFTADSLKTDGSPPSSFSSGGN